MSAVAAAEIAETTASALEELGSGPPNALDYRASGSLEPFFVCGRTRASSKIAYVQGFLHRTLGHDWATARSSASNKTTE